MLLITNVCANTYNAHTIMPMYAHVHTYNTHAQAHLVLQHRHLVPLFEKFNDDSIPKPKPTTWHVITSEGA
jgi:hypothetical protein